MVSHVHSTVGKRRGKSEVYLEVHLVRVGVVVGSKLSKP